MLDFGGENLVNIYLGCDVFINKRERYQIVSLKLNDIVKNDFNLNFTEEEEAVKLIEHDNSLFVDQLKRIDGDRFIRKSGSNVVRMPQVILVEAKKNDKKTHLIEQLITSGFNYSGVHYVRYGKSASQGKDGITMFVDESVYDELFVASILDIYVDECVTSKYESQRCLTLSTCILVEEKLPNIVIVDEYTTVLQNNEIRYVKEVVREGIDKDTKQPFTYKVREIEDGVKDLEISPFDGCGCHTAEMSGIWADYIGLTDYTPCLYQIRLPFFKGVSVEVPFREILKDMGISKITDVCGNEHNVDDIDCIWNTSMWKGFGLFKREHGISDAWNKYIGVLNKYSYKLGISKYSHHINNINLKTRMNYQYLQCLDLWNDYYVDAFNNKKLAEFDQLDESKWGNMIKLARYTTELYEKIIMGDKFYTCKFFGIDDTNNEFVQSAYLKSVLLNEEMLKDPSVMRFIYAKLRKLITEAKIGKIYADGLYNTVVGDMIGYLQYAAGLEVTGCLNAGEFYCGILPNGKTLSFRSPLICPSEVNEVQLVTNEVTERWFSKWKLQDIVMINMHDLSMPQQGGMDADGDAVFLCNDPLLLNTKIHKRMIIDIDDKITTSVKPYNAQSVLDYELASRDNRIGEITTVATGISNQYTKDPARIKENEDNISLLRIFQGKEIDFQKTGVRWQLNRNLRRHIKKVPYFLLYNYPTKLKTYTNRKRINKGKKSKEGKIELNAFYSPSPLNELCSYVMEWETHSLFKEMRCGDTRHLVVNKNVVFSDTNLIKKIKRELSKFSIKWRELLALRSEDDKVDLNAAVEQIKSDLRNLLPNDLLLLGEYVVYTSYMNVSTDKSVAWMVYSDIILKNIKENSPPEKQYIIVETEQDDEKGYEYLGKYYRFIESEKKIKGGEEYVLYR